MCKVPLNIRVPKVLVEGLDSIVGVTRLGPFACKRSDVAVEALRIGLAQLQAALRESVTEAGATTDATASPAEYATSHTAPEVP